MSQTSKGQIPQTTRVLANEDLAGHLARMIGSSVPEPVILFVDDEIIREYSSRPVQQLF